MLDSKVVALLNDQVNKEFYSAYLYLDFSNFYEDKGLEGFANWYKIQAQEERDHAMLFYQYLHNNNVKVSHRQTRSGTQFVDGFSSSRPETRRIRHQLD